MLCPARPWLVGGGEGKEGRKEGRRKPGLFFMNDPLDQVMHAGVGVSNCHIGENIFVLYRTNRSPAPPSLVFFSKRASIALTAISLAINLALELTFVLALELTFVLALELTFVLALELTFVLALELTFVLALPYPLCMCVCVCVFV